MSTIDATVIDEVADGIDAALTEWLEGRNASPSDRDYVLIAHEVLKAKQPGYDKDLLEHEDEWTEALSVAMESGQWESVREIAEWLTQQMTA